jgi:hypothetical protein
MSRWYKGGRVTRLNKRRNSIINNIFFRIFQIMHPTNCIYSIILNVNN